jgi:phosphate transport system permease protein
MHKNQDIKNHINPQRMSRRFTGKLLYILFLSSVSVGIIGLAVLIFEVLNNGIPWLSWHFLTDYPSRHPKEAGLFSALMGTIWLMFMTAIFTVPIGVGAAIYLEEYAPRNLWTKIIEINVANLAGVPSIVYGLLGLSWFVYYWGTPTEFLGRTLLAGAMTLSLLVLPIVILASREAIKAVPDSYRDAAYALGGDKWQVIKGSVLPSALPGILTGTILAMSRAIGEAAPVIAISALVYITYIPSHPMERFTVLPIQIFNWISRPQDDFRGLAAAGIIVMLFLLLTMNAIAVYFRNRYQIKSEE